MALAAWRCGSDQDVASDAPQTSKALQRIPQSNQTAGHTGDAQGADQVDDDGQVPFALAQVGLRFSRVEGVPAVVANHRANQDRADRSQIPRPWPSLLRARPAARTSNARSQRRRCGGGGNGDGLTTLSARASLPGVTLVDLAPVLAMGTRERYQPRAGRRRNTERFRRRRSDFLHDFNFDRGGNLHLGAALRARRPAAGQRILNLKRRGTLASHVDAHSGDPCNMTPSGGQNTQRRF